jgi:hypothetical protein
MNGTEGTMNGTEGSLRTIHSGRTKKFIRVRAQRRSRLLALLESLLGRGNGVVGFVVGGAHG